MADAVAGVGGLRFRSFPVPRAGHVDLSHVKLDVTPAELERKAQTRALNQPFKMSRFLCLGASFGLALSLGA